MKLTEALNIKPGEVISLVGGGGKTTLMFALAGELASSGGMVITTTTTMILPPSSGETPFLLLERDETRLIAALLRHIGKYRHITLARERQPSGKLRGLSPELIAKLARLNGVAYTIVEADGAAGKSLKAPSHTEPVIPDTTSLVIPVVGIDAAGCRLTETNVFRSATVAKLLGLPLGEVISTEAIAGLVTHPRGITRGSPSQASIIPFINKVDLAQGLARGREVARRIMAVRHPRIERVVLGQAQSPRPVVEVISKSH